MEEENKSKVEEPNESENSLEQNKENENNIKTESNEKKKAKRYKEKEPKKKKERKNREKGKERKEKENKNEDNENSKLDNSENETIELNKETSAEKHSKTKSKTAKRIVITLVIIILIATIAVGGYFAYLKFSKKFKDVSIELGTETVELNQFVIDEKYIDGATFVTDMSTIDLSKVGSYEVELSYDNISQKVLLNVVDTTAPEVEFQNLDKYLDYELNADDFIKSKTDLSEMTTSIIDPPEINGIGTYEINVEVKDSSGNTTSNICTLNVSRVVKEFTLELGDELEKKDILLNYKEDKDAIKQSDIDKINKEEVGEYTITTIIDGEEETVTITIKDTKAPTLKLKNVTIYDDEKIDGKEDFIESVKDASGDVKTTLKTEIDYTKIGKQEVTIEAEDKYGNKVEKTATLTIKKDTEGPVFYGLSSMSVEKKSSPNFKSGVRAVDARDGSCTFTVNTSKLNLSKAGTYYITYTAKDKKGNTSTASRQVTVNHNQEDTNNKFNQFYNQYLAGKSVKGIVETIRNKIYYNTSWGGSDPVWYGLTNYTGNCYVHAVLVQKALNKAGIRNQLIYTTDKTHYWNLVYQNGSWRHYDATPGGHLLGPATDKQKLESSSMQGRKWSSSFPKAE